MATLQEQLNDLHCAQEFSTYGSFTPLLSQPQQPPYVPQPQPQPQPYYVHVPQVPNASPTAASASSDMYGAAVLDACEQIKARMEPITSRHNFSSFAEVAVMKGKLMTMIINCEDDQLFSLF
ncbi:hypothetical protein L1049_012882 [Liquidambar formosana]|uniref:Aldehyde oxidase/xanthine dehydrogenase second molybdopterin binding domain-containing protein n=1 Tax=Liquidambar formosana TaxID=63359 RepID=A0AAP0WTL3_LIQFO